MKLGETEQIENNLNPQFVKSFEVKYYFEREQFLKFDVYDIGILKIYSNNDWVCKYI